MVTKKTYRLVAFMGLIVIAVLSVLPYFAPANPLVIEDAVGESTVYIEAERDWMLFPGQCMQVQWELEGIAGVYVQDLQPERGTVGVGEQVDCYAPNFSLRVIFADASTQTYTFDAVRYGYQQIQWQLYYAFLTILGAICAYLAIGARAVTAIVATIAVTPTMILHVLTPFTGYRYIEITDYVVHVRWAQIASLQTLGEIPPHMLFHFAGRALIELMPALYHVVPIIVLMIACQTLTAVGLHTLLRLLHPIEDDAHAWQIAYIALSVMLIFIGPLSMLAGTRLFEPGSALLYPNTYHSPTMVMMRPLALWLFIALISVPKTDAHIGWLVLRWAWIVLLTIAVTFTKPNYTFVIMPAYITLLAWQKLLKREVTRNELFTAGVLVLSGSLVLGWQYFTLSAGTSQVGETSIALMPFWYFTSRDIAIPMVIWQWMVSLIFPLAVVILFFKQAIKDEVLTLAWIAIGGAIAITVLFVEFPRNGAGNFLWGTRIANLILFTTSLGFLLQRLRESDDKWDIRFMICEALLLAHFVDYVLVLVAY
ncbi:MAG: hypothetical protein AAFR81_09025 [Chloroflexota bacterium]